VSDEKKKKKKGIGAYREERKPGLFIAVEGKSALFPTKGFDEKRD